MVMYVFTGTNLMFFVNLYLRLVPAFISLRDSNVLKVQRRRQSVEIKRQI